MKRLALLGLVLVVLLVAGCTSSTESTSGETQTSGQVSGQTKNIMINYSATTEDAVFSESGYPSQAESGKVFLVVSMAIKNNGYEKFSTNLFYFSVIANNVKYDVDASTYSIEDGLDSVDVLDGGVLTGKVVFQIPQSASSGYILSYKSFETYNIVWSKV